MYVCWSLRSTMPPTARVSEGRLSWITALTTTLRFVHVRNKLTPQIIATWILCSSSGELDVAKNGGCGLDAKDVTTPLRTISEHPRLSKPQLSDTSIIRMQNFRSHTHIRKPHGSWWLRNLAKWRFQIVKSNAECRKCNWRETEYLQAHGYR